MAEDTRLYSLVEALRCNGSAWVSHDDPLHQGQSDLGLFNDVSARLQETLGDENFSLNLTQQADGVLFTLKVGKEADETPDFSPPEPRLL